MCAFLPSLFSNDKIKSLFTPWKLGSISKSKNSFSFFIATFDLYLFQLIVLLKPDFNILVVVIVSHYFGLTQLKQEHCNCKFCLPSLKRNNTECSGSFSCYFLSWIIFYIISWFISVILPQSSHKFFRIIITIFY